MTWITLPAENRHTAGHHQRESPTPGSGRQNRYTDSAHTASANRRHTFGTRLINRDVPQEVVRVLLDHSSGEMTAHYANSQELHQTGEKPQVSRSQQGRDGVPYLQMAAV
jgi:hypothetical protein